MNFPTKRLTVNALPVDRCVQRCQPSASCVDAYISHSPQLCSQLPSTVNKTRPHRIRRHLQQVRTMLYDQRKTKTQPVIITFCCMRSTLIIQLCKPTANFSDQSELPLCGGFDQPLLCCSLPASNSNSNSNLINNKGLKATFRLLKQ